jgi:hypothetical protein
VSDHESWKKLDTIFPLMSIKGSPGRATLRFEKELSVLSGVYLSDLAGISGVTP